MKTKIFYRDIDFKDELEHASKYFECIPIRSKIEKDDFIIGRYAVLPYYNNLQEDVDYIGAKLINTYKQHRFVADLWNWCYWFGDITPKTYNRLEDVPETSSYGFVLKGETNSKKFLWDTHMYAADKQTAIKIYCDLQTDGLLQHQKIYIREYVPLETYFTSFHGLPITKEFRLFICNGQVISKGFYWAGYVDDIEGGEPNPEEIPEKFIQDIIYRVGKNINFFVVDIAKTQSGEWIVIELNDGQMSGLSCNKPETFYHNLRSVLEK